ncbi:MAG TPA: hypothetical protein VKG91_04450 [Roseiarcus sp.]|nr:hypothetical protein [Roseiarcus sp.]
MMMARLAAIGLIGILAGAGPASACDGFGCVGAAIEQGAYETGHAIESGVRVTGAAIDRGAHGLGSAVQTGAHATAARQRGPRTRPGDW